MVLSMIKTKNFEIFSFLRFRVFNTDGGGACAAEYESSPFASVANGERFRGCFGYYYSDSEVTYSLVPFFSHSISGNAEKIDF